MINESGIVPVEYKVLVKIDSVEEKTQSGIILTKKTTEREELAQVKGVLLDYGGSAFTDWKGKTPTPGDRVMVAKYAGSVVEGCDGEEYRLCNDKDIAAILVKEA